MEKEDFKNYLTHWSVAPNPSNQNFHNKFIRALAINYKVDVISIRPFSSSLVDLPSLPYEKKEEGNITWHYLPISGKKIFRIFKCKKDVKLLIKQLYTNESIIFTDTINTSLIFYLNRARKNNNYHIVGLATDSPSNISNTRRSYTTFLLNNTNNFSAYIALTKELDELYNPYCRLSTIIEGIVEKAPKDIKKPTNDQYFFFGGALLERYGIYQLIDAFNDINVNYPDVKLYIAGHHADKKKLEFITIKNQNIKFLGILPYESVLAYEKYALANINPRPFSEDLDRFSIPSKTLEYMASSRPTISVKNSKLAKYFEKEIVWAKSSNKEDLYEAMEKVLTASKDINKEITSSASEKVNELFGFKAVSDKVKELIDQLD